MALPDKRTFITSLISSLPTPNSPAPNPLKEASATEKSILLALHVLFPNELLSALDLLDRVLVTRMLVHGQTIESSENVSHDQDSRESKSAVYYVRSARQQSSHSRFRDANFDSMTHYEVRPLAWSCSCPAFVFSAFPAGSLSSTRESAAAEGTESEALVDKENVDPDSVSMDEDRGWNVGGLSLGDEVPICKHLLACVLVEHGGSFKRFVKEEKVSVEEMAGWAAGWGG